MSGAESGWGRIWAINLRFLRAFACAVIARGCWWAVENGLVWMMLFAAMFAAGAVVHGAIALGQTLLVIIGSLKWIRFSRGHAKPKADPIAKTADLRAKGILK